MASNRPLVFRYTAPSLKNITAALIAVRLWKSKIVDGSFRHIFHVSPSQFVFDNSLPLPKTLVGPINRYISFVEIELEKWTCFYGFRVFNSQRRVFDVLKERFDEIAWHPDGTVDEVQTARNMLQWPCLTILDKLKIACAYCFVEDIQRLRPSLPDDTDLSRISFEEDPLLYYWEHWYRDQLEGTVTPDLHLGGVRMVSTSRVDRWAALEFLFGKMSSFERRQCASMITLHGNSFVLKKMLAILDEEELQRLIFILGDEVMTCLLRCPDSRQEARQAWAYIKEKVDRRRFLEMIRWMWRAESAFNSPMPEDVLALFVDIWAESPDRLKRFAIRRTFADTALYSYRAAKLPRLPRNLRFFMTMLSDASPAARSAVWRNHWPDLVRGTHPIYIKDLMKLCLAEDEIDDFRENTMAEFEFVKDYCRDLLKQDCFGELDTYLRFCLKNEAKIFRFKEHLIKWYSVQEENCTFDRLCFIVERMFREIDVFLVHESGVDLQSNDEDAGGDSVGVRDVEESTAGEIQNRDRSAFMKFFETALGKFRQRFLKSKPPLNYDVTYRQR